MALHMTVNGVVEYKTAMVKWYLQMEKSRRGCSTTMFTSVNIRKKNQNRS